MINLTDVGKITDFWQELVSHRPSEALQRRAHAEGFYFQPIEGMAGYTVPPDETQSNIFNVNLDFYPVRILLMPKIKLPSFLGLSETPRILPDALLNSIRINYFSGFLDPEIAVFRPYDDQHNAQWISDNPLGSVVSINMLDDGSVHCSLYEKRRWIFSTITTPKDDFHPVRGNREFGYYTEFPNQEQPLLLPLSTEVPPSPKGTYRDGMKHAFIMPSYIFYTKGADRISTGLGEMFGQGLAFEDTDRLWRSLQQNICNLVNNNNGIAVIEHPYSARHEWRTIKNDLWRPKNSWVRLY